jgi:PKD repeat protein
MVGVLVIVVLAVPGGVLGARPLNDDFADATRIDLGNMVFSVTADLTEATIQPGEPGGDPSGDRRSLWYSIAPTADGVVIVTRRLVPPDPGSPPTLCQLRTSNWMTVYRADGVGLAGLAAIAQGSGTIRVAAGATYYVQVGDIQYGTGGGCPNTFPLDVSLVPPPSNDSFADAIPFTSVPFSDAKDLTGATVEPGEPTGCGETVTGSAWYSFTPSVSASYGSADPGVNAVTVYAGTSLDDLELVECYQWPGVYFWANAGTTYYLQYHGGGMRIDAVSPPVADFRYAPGTPSTSDDVVFSYYNGGYWDPTVTGWDWRFGDGTTASGESVSHRYAANGDYSVTLTVSARGGRSSIQSYVLSVRQPDTTPPAIVVVDQYGGDDFSYNATSPVGGRVDYTATVTDESDPSPSLNCEPASGTERPIGVTSVVCTATDTAGNTSDASFDLSVLSAPEQLAILRVRAAEIGRPGTSLADKIVDTQAALEMGELAKACSTLNAFLHQVDAQAGKGIAPETASDLTRDATRIRAVLGC